MMKDLYGFAVCKCNISPEYFLYDMGIEELNSVYDAYMDSYRDDWEKVRSLYHAAIAPHSSKPVSAKDVMPFSWDKDVKKEKAVTTKEDFIRIKESFKKNIKPPQNSGSTKQ